MSMEFDLRMVKLAKEKFNKDQGIVGPVPEGRLSWEECLEFSMPENPLYDVCFEQMANKAIAAALTECN